MEFILEILLELVLDGTFEISKSKKVPKFIRYFLIIFIILLFLGVTLLIFYTGVLTYHKMDKIVGILFVILGVTFLVVGITKFKKIYLIKKK